MTASGPPSPSPSAAPRLTSVTVQRTYVTLMLGNTLAASLIWGINTIFLLDAGLSNFEAFAANAFFTAGMVLFEIPTGIIADTRGRRASYLLGTAVLVLSTALYLLLWWIEGPFWAWAVSSALLGLGFTFFSGAVEAWLVDALAATGYRGSLEAVFGKGQMATGAAMLTGSVGGGLLAEVTNLGVPFALRAVILLVMFVVAARLMHDLGFTPHRTGTPLADMRQLVSTSVEHGLRNPPVRWVMLAGPFSAGVGVYVFYALQPYVLELYGDPEAYAVAGLVAAAVAAAQIAGGFVAPHVRRLVRRRTTVLVVGSVLTAALLVAVGSVDALAGALVLVVGWALVSAVVMPVQQAFVNDLIPSSQRATVLSFQSLLGSSGGVVAQPVLGRVADASGYGASLVVSGGLSLLSAPFLWLARRERVPADLTERPAAG